MPATSERATMAITASHVGTSRALLAFASTRAIVSVRGRSFFGSSPSPRSSRVVPPSRLEPELGARSPVERSGAPAIRGVGGAALTRAPSPDGVERARDDRPAADEAPAARKSERRSETSRAEAGRDSGFFSSIANSISSTPRGRPLRTSSSSAGAGAVHWRFKSSRGDAEENGGSPAIIS